MGFPLNQVPYLPFVCLFAMGSRLSQCFQQKKFLCKSLASLAEEQHVVVLFEMKTRQFLFCSDTLQKLSSKHSLSSFGLFSKKRSRDGLWVLQRWFVRINQLFSVDSFKILI
ncbi:unnamed protein product [Brassica rapa]|uniref:Uncharacterized protein n=1 Tax=Brassica campestris TaxID=3711 RepID=A0A8D9DJB4_BRACM|nr:unnamed protein product [Brassica rapa]